MVAIAVRQVELDKWPDLKEHLSDCDACRSQLESIKSLPGRSNDEIFETASVSGNSNNCARDAVEMSSVLILFLKNQLSDAQSLQVVSHLNSCYTCFESISRNWNDYLRMTN